MPTKYMVNWALWIGMMSGLYVFLYLLTPLAAYGVIWMTFVALPIYFNGGAKPEEYLSYVVSMAIGVVWGLIYLFLIGALIEAGVNAVFSTAFVVGVICALQCAVHFTLTAKTPVKMVPIMFGAVSMCFSQGGANVVPVFLTLFGGLTLALVCGLGTRLLTEEGNWKFLSAGNMATNMEAEPEVVAEVVAEADVEGNME